MIELLAASPDAVQALPFAFEPTYDLSDAVRHEHSGSSQDCCNGCGSYQSTSRSPPANCALCSVYSNSSTFTPLGSAVHACHVLSIPSFLSETTTSWARSRQMAASNEPTSRHRWSIGRKLGVGMATCWNTSMKVRSPAAR